MSKNIHFSQVVPVPESSVHVQDQDRQLPSSFEPLYKFFADVQALAGVVRSFGAIFVFKEGEVFGGGEHRFVFLGNRAG